MKKILTTLTLLTCVSLIAAPPPPRGGHATNHRPSAHRQPPPPRHHHHYSHHYNELSAIGFGIGLLGGSIISSQPKTVVVTTPIVVNQPTKVWVEGRYVDQIQPNGTIIRVWKPGHYENIQ